MLRRLLACWFVLAFCFGYTSTPPPDPLRLGEIADIMWQPRVKVTTSWETCGQVNAFYDPDNKHVTMCYELLPFAAENPGWLRYVYAHELAHAIIVQRDIPYTGSHEMAADELAAVLMTMNGRAQDIADAGRFWSNRGVNNPAWADHPDDDERGYSLLCLASGSTFKGPCAETYIRAWHAWMRLLGYDLGA